MPCKKCKDGKYKYGNTGECKYDTKEECEKANPKKYNKMKQEPSPLGKKTYAEYEKELKEFNLSKVKKVELGIIQDFEKITNKAEDNYEKLISDMKELNKIANVVVPAVKNTRKLSKSVLSLIKSSEQAFKNYRKTLSIAQKQAKELGVNLDDVKPINNAKAQVQKLIGELDQAEQLLAAVTKLIKI